METSDKGRGQFEEAWRKSLSDGAVPPSEGLWDRLDSKLSHSNVFAYKKQVSILKYVAAAAVALAILSTSAAIYLWQASDDVLSSDNIPTEDTTPSVNEFQTLDEVVQDRSNRTVVENQPLSESKKSKENSQAIAGLSGENIQNIGREEEDLADQSQTNNLSYAVSDGAPSGSGFFRANLFNEEGMSDDANEARPTSDRDHLTSRHIASIKLPAEAALPVKPMPATTEIDLPSYWVTKTYVSNGPSKKSKSWAGLNMGMGSYSANSQGSIDPVAANFAERADQLNLGGMALPIADFMGDTEVVEPTENLERPGYGFSFGVNAAMPVWRKFYLISGFQFSQMVANGRSESFAQDASTGVNSIIFNNTSYAGDDVFIRNTDSYEIQNTFEFVSIPVIIGYRLERGKFNASLIGGVSADFLLKNTITGRNVDYQPVTIRTGEASPYRNVNLTTILGTEFAYRIGKKYAIAIEPAYRFSMGSITKENSNFKSFPSSFQLGFRLRYDLN